MARRPFFSGNYGSALGSTANAANLIAQAGQAQGQMFANLGKIAGESIQKYSENKKKKEEEKQTTSFIKNYLKNKPDVAAQFGIKGNNLITFEEAVDQSANAIAKNPKGMESIKGLMEIQRINAEETRKANAFKQLIAQREGQLEMANIDLAPQPPTYTDPGGTFNANTGNRAGDRSTVQGMQNFLKNNPNLMPKTPEGKIQLANRFQDIRGANVPKEPTISEQIALAKRADELELKASEKRQREILLNETSDILEIIKSGKDVTGQVEGLDFVRALKKSVGYGKEDEKLRRKLERYANKFTLENVSKLKGPLSEKELAFIQQSSPKITDEPEVWVDFLTGLEEQLNTESQGQIPQVNPSAPASQSLLDEIKRKRQLRSQRAGL